MANEPSHPPSFSVGRRWGLFFSVMISIVAMLALMVMMNYLGARYYARWALSKHSDIKLSARTISLLKSITNDVKVVIYYDKNDNLYGSVASLLNEYRLTNPKISVQTVDYLFNASEAQQVKTVYKLGPGQDKNVVIFECNGRQKIVPASELGDYTITAIPGEKERNFEKHLKSFDGERRFSSALINVISTKPRKAYFLEGHGEHSLESASNDGYQKFGMLLEENSVTPGVVRLLGTNLVPADCNLLVIAGPRRPIPAEELKKIGLYLDQGGRLFVLFNSATRNIPTGLEAILGSWNVKVGMNIVTDPQNSQSGKDVEVIFFNPNHPVSKQLQGSTLEMVEPRSIEAFSVGKQGPESPTVTTLASTGNGAAISGVPVGVPVTLIAAIEKQGIPGVVSPGSSTAMVVVGDSLVLDNQLIEAGDNRDFGTLALNWLLDQRQLVQGIGPHPVTEYKLMMTTGQFNTIRWIFLGAMPGGILAFGVLVWFRRRR